MLERTLGILKIDLKSIMIIMWALNQLLILFSLIGYKNSSYMAVPNSPVYMIVWKQAFINGRIWK